MTVICPTSPPLISVVIPIYNGANFISRCLESVINQNVVCEFEIICINDGSSDNTSEICRKYTEKYNFIRLIEQTNSGVTVARRNGVVASEGEWICFVDCDDTLPQNSLKILSDCCSDKYDIIVGEALHETCPKDMQNREYRKGMVRGDVSTSPCAKLYRKSIFSTETFDIPPHIIYGEDMIMNIRLAFQTEKTVRFTGKVVYSYIKNSNSVSHSFKKTADYEEMFADAVCRAIPDPFKNDKDYIFARITCKVKGWRGINFLHLSIDENCRTLFYRHLLEEIDEYKYPVGWQNWLHLYGKSKLFRMIAISLDLLPIVKYKILYRLKQMLFI